MGDKGDIWVKELSVSFEREGGKRRAVENVSFTVPPGSIVSIVGPSGCGKTTILRALLGFVPYTGEAEIDSERRMSMSYLQQESHLLPWRNTLQNAALGQELRGRIDESTIRRLRDLLEDFGLGGFEEYYPSELSGGMKQRIAVVRALESSPKILLCDEPFSAIDFVNRLKLNKMFKRRCNTSNVSVLMVTHNIEEAIFLSNQIIVLRGEPGHVSNTVYPDFGKYIKDPVAMREDPRFEQYFLEIWKSMGAV